MMKKIVFTALILTSLYTPISFSQEGSDAKDLKKMLDRLNSRLDDIEHRNDELEKKIDDILWNDKVGDIALIDKVQLFGPPLANIKNPKEMGAKNPLLFYAYVFIPKTVDKSKKYPLIVFPHGGVHSNFSTYYARAVREMVAQGYVVVAPEYRGSTGYGGDMYNAIDYGALENEDVFASKKFMVENYSFIDKGRVGIFGWSHGATIALFNIIHHPDDYKVAYAGEPVSDLIYRMGYSTDGYRTLFSADYHIGKTVREDVEEYKKRSAIWLVDSIKTPLLIHTNTNDADVYALEVQLLINAMKAAKKKFEYEIYENKPGGHSFDRLDTKESKEIQLKIFNYLAKYLDPPKPFKSIKDLEEAGYK